MADKQPNMLVLMTDQHSKHVLGAYGNEIIRTPNMDRLAAEGMRFTNTYCPAPLCIPCRSSFMTTLLGQSRKAVVAAGHGSTAFHWADQQVTDCACEFLEATVIEKGV